MTQKNVENIGLVIGPYIVGICPKHVGTLQVKFYGAFPKHLRRPTYSPPLPAERSRPLCSDNFSDFFFFSSLLALSFLARGTSLFASWSFVSFVALLALVFLLSFFHVVFRSCLVSFCDFAFVFLFFSLPCLFFSFVSSLSSPPCSSLPRSLHFAPFFLRLLAHRSIFLVLCSCSLVCSPNVLSPLFHFTYHPEFVELQFLQNKPQSQLFLPCKSSHSCPGRGCTDNHFAATHLLRRFLVALLPNVLSDEKGVAGEPMTAVLAVHLAMQASHRSGSGWRYRVPPEGFGVRCLF